MGSIHPAAGRRAEAPGGQAPSRPRTGQPAKSPPDRSFRPSGGASAAMKSSTARVCVPAGAGRNPPSTSLAPEFRRFHGYRPRSATDPAWPRRTGPVARQGSARVAASGSKPRRVRGRAPARISISPALAARQAGEGHQVGQLPAGRAPRRSRSRRGSAAPSTRRDDCQVCPRPYRHRRPGRYRNRRQPARLGAVDDPLAQDGAAPGSTWAAS